MWFLPELEWVQEQDLKPSITSLNGKQCGSCHGVCTGLVPLVSVVPDPAPVPDPAHVPDFVLFWLVMVK